MFIFTHTDGKTYEVAIDYVYTGPKNKVICVQARVCLYEIVGTLELPHKTKGRVFVPEKSIRGEQHYAVWNKCSKRQARERALSNLLRRKGFSRAERLTVFSAYYTKIRQSQLASAALREAGYRREAEKVTVAHV